MLAARDQENRVHTQQTTAAGKSLNHGVRPLHPKTPGPAKTPFRRAPNDENRQQTQKGKTVLRDGPSRAAPGAFVTPAPNRAVLGMKTTNARGQAFQTPLPKTLKPEKTAQKPSTARRSARSKITIAPSEPVQADVLSRETEEDDEPDYGYAPPPIVELPDPPMDLGYDDTFPQFRGANFFRGYGEIYCTSPTDKNGMSIRQKEEDARRKKYMEEMERKASEPIAGGRLPTHDELNAQVDAMIISGEKSRLDTMKAKSAARALVGVPATAMKTTKSSEQKRKPLSSITSAPSSRAVPTNIPPPVSKNTIGFPKARKAPSIIPFGDQMRQQQQRKQMSATQTPKPSVPKQADLHPREFVTLYGQPPAESDMWFRLKEYELLEQEDIDNGVSDTLFDTDVYNGEEPELGLDEGDEVFQLPMPE